MDLSKVTNVEIDGIDTRDYPDFCDAFICSADYDGKEMTDSQLDELNDNQDFVYQKTLEYLF